MRKPFEPYLNKKTDRINKSWMTLLPEKMLLNKFANHFVKVGNHMFLAHLGHWLMVSYCDRWMSIVRRATCVNVPRQQLLQRTSPPKLLPGF